MANRPTPDLQHGTSAVVIAQAIRNDIEAGRLAHGRQLPSTRALAEEWRTSVATINRAMSILAEEGIVVNRARSSRIVNYPLESTAGQHRSRQPTVILIGGYAGSGKTELGRIIARRTGWPILDKDTTTRPVVEVALELLGESPQDRESENYINVVRPTEYEALISTVAENVQCGNSAIVTAPFIHEFNDPAWCERMTANMESMGARVHAVWVDCDAETMHMYLRHRGAARDTGKLANWTNYTASINLAFRPSMKHHVIDNSANSRPLQQQAVEMLNRIAVQ